jgi:hypothetical protein
VLLRITSQCHYPTDALSGAATPPCQLTLGWYRLRPAEAAR